MRALIVPLNATVRALETGLRIAAALCLGVMFALVVAQVVLRYSGGGVPVFTEEAARYAMIWMALLATAVAAREGSHIRIDFVPMGLAARAPAWGRALEFLLDLIAMGVFVTLIIEGIDMVQFSASQRSEGLRVPLSWPYSALPLSFGFAALFALARLISTEVRTREGQS
jgi:TRAP-type C4-dicarboxylate transport system permease small subunit